MSMGSRDQLAGAELMVAAAADQYVAALEVGDRDTVDRELAILRDHVRYLREA